MTLSKHSPRPAAAAAAAPPLPASPSVPPTQQDADERTSSPSALHAGMVRSATHSSTAPRPLMRRGSTAYPGTMANTRALDPGGPDADAISASGSRAFSMPDLVDESGGDKKDFSLRRASAAVKDALTGRAKPGGGGGSGTRGGKSSRRPSALAGGGGEQSREGSATLLSRIKKHVRSIVDLNPFNVGHHGDAPPAAAPEPPPISSSLRVYIGTWNMHGMLPDSLSPFIPALNESAFVVQPNVVPLPPGYHARGTSAAGSGADGSGSSSHHHHWHWPHLGGQHHHHTSATTHGDGSTSAPAMGSNHHLAGGSAPPDRSRPAGDPAGSHPFHLLVIGTQECQKSISEAVMFPSKAEWERQILLTFGRFYELVRCDTMGALHLCVLVWRACAHLVSRVETSCVPTGIGGVVGNKGGVGIAIDFASTSLLFVNVHLTAHQDNVSLRNADYLKIETGLHLPLHMPPPAPSMPQGLPRLASDAFDYAFFFGDTNYRIDGNHAAITHLIETNRLDACLNNDQLTAQRRAGHTFIGFQEAPIRFAPTFKLIVPPPGSAVEPSAATAFAARKRNRRATIFSRSINAISSSAAAAWSGTTPRKPARNPALEYPIETITTGEELPAADLSAAATTTTVAASMSSSSAASQSMAGATSDLSSSVSASTDQQQTSTTTSETAEDRVPTMRRTRTGSTGSGTKLNTLALRITTTVSDRRRRRSEDRTSGSKSALSPVAPDCPSSRRYNPQRVPAWTDRILYKSRNDLGVSLPTSTAGLAAGPRRDETALSSNGGSITAGGRRKSTREDLGATTSIRSRSSSSRTRNSVTDLAAALSSSVAGSRRPSSRMLGLPGGGAAGAPHGHKRSGSGLASAVECPLYCSVPGQAGSDHFPVVGVFDLQFDWTEIKLASGIEAEQISRSTVWNMLGSGRSLAKVFPVSDDGEPAAVGSGNEVFVDASLMPPSMEAEEQSGEFCAAAPGGTSTNQLAVTTGSLPRRPGAAGTKRSSPFARRPSAEPIRRPSNASPATPLTAPATTTTGGGPPPGLSPIDTTRRPSVAEGGSLRSNKPKGSKLARFRSKKWKRKRKRGSTAGTEDSFAPPTSPIGPPTPRSKAHRDQCSIM
ncbi:hypothetical protein H9P43_005776 [Blastocladiella emersonii ATCC 22665]|nr:hypothetical protein H9P43_005776 [Blastocladiella emersonii ATCC 22665]